MNRTGILRTTGAAALALGASLAIGLPAQAASPASTHGTCSATSTYKVNASANDDSITVKAKIKTDTAGETWGYTVADNGTTVVTGDATSAKNGKVKIRETIPNLDGTDTIDVTATDSVTGETCVAEVLVED
jgi:hypothetical protein